MMLSNLIVTSQKFVLIADNIGVGKYSYRFIEKWLSEQGQNSFKIRSSLHKREQNHNMTMSILKQIDEFNGLMESNTNQMNTQNNLNIILPNVTELLILADPTEVFQLLHNLKRNNKLNIRQFFLWASRDQIKENFVIPFLEHMADLIIHINDLNSVTIVSKKTGGLVSRKRYNYRISGDEFTVESAIGDVSNKSKIDQLNSILDTIGGTFKIDLEEEELVARNSLKLPYEKRTEEKESEIIYSPDAFDDFDDEDPDEDLCI